MLQEGLFETRSANREIRNWNCAISRPFASLDLHRGSKNEKCEASQTRDRGGNFELRNENRAICAEKSVASTPDLVTRNRKAEVFRILPGFLFWDLLAGI